MRWHPVSGQPADQKTCRHPGTAKGLARTASRGEQPWHGNPFRPARAKTIPSRNPNRSRDPIHPSTWIGPACNLSFPGLTHWSVFPGHQSRSSLRRPLRRPVCRRDARFQRMERAAQRSSSRAAPSREPPSTLLPVAMQDGIFSLPGVYTSTCSRHGVQTSNSDQTAPTL